jgi:tRNA(fMet)-specific endonuclease VapC
VSEIRVALDTSTAVRILNSDATVLARFSLERRVGIPTVVAGELLFGAFNSNLGRANVARYRRLILGGLLLPVDLDVADEYARLRLALKRLGKPIPVNDCWIAATCLHHGVVLATSDAHFSHCPGLVTEDWTI